MARLAATVFVKDPDSYRTVELPKGSTPPMRLAVLVTNPVAWEGGHVPVAVAKAAAADPEVSDGGNDGEEEGSGASSDDPPGDPDPSPGDEPTPKTPAKKAAAKRPSRGKAADQGTGGQ